MSENIDGLVNPVTASFNTNVRQMTKISRWSKCGKKTMTDMSQRKKCPACNVGVDILKIEKDPCMRWSPFIYSNSFGQ